MKRSFITVRKFAEEPYSKILGYPKASKTQINSRIIEIQKLGITSLSLSGTTVIGKLSILGKGYVGVVVLGKKGEKYVAIKIRRTDSQRREMKTEAKMLKLVNSVNVGPKLVSASRNFMVMEFLAGQKIGDWIKNLQGKGAVKELKFVIKSVLEDCYKMDQIGFDHGELSSISKHVIVGKSKSVLIDFESSSTKRRVSNVTSATQAIFIGSGIAKKVHRLYRLSSKEAIIETLRTYKQEPSRKSFEGVLRILKLQ